MQRLPNGPRRTGRMGGKEMTKWPRTLHAQLLVYPDGGSEFKVTGYDFSYAERVVVNGLLFKPVIRRIKKGKRK